MQPKGCVTDGMNELYNQVINSSISFPVLVKEMRRYSKEGHQYERAVRIAVIGSSSVQYLTSILKFNLNLRGIGVETFEGPYDGINASILNLDNDLVSFSPQFVIVLPHYTDVKQYPSVFSKAEEYEALISSEIERQRLIWNNLEKINNVHVLQCNYVVPYVSELGSYEASTINSKNNYLREINRRLVQSRPSFVSIVDLDSFAAQVGKENWFDFPGYFSTKSGFALQYILPVSNLMARLIISIMGKPKKCLVMDLDNTLWGDVVGEVGINGIVLDPNDPEGEAYRFFQTYIKSLKNRGVILAVCSKNDEDIAKEAFKANPNMVLSLDDISCFVANWNDKASNIERIAKELNIGIDSLVFIDDNHAEREIVRQNHPEVLVIDLPDDPDGYTAALFNSGAFDWAEITEEDILRSNTYIANAKREELLRKNVDYDSYLESLEMEAQILPVDDSNKERFVQLINKSNQFNLTTRRTTEKAVQQMIVAPEYDLLAVYLQDRFSYYGNIACLILKQNNNQLVIDTYVMSCRVLKRGLEDYILEFIVECAKRRGCDEIVGEYIRTERNGMVRNLYDDYGFEIIQDNGENRTYLLRIENYCNPTNNHIKHKD